MKNGSRDEKMGEEKKAETDKQDEERREKRNPKALKEKWWKLARVENEDRKRKLEWNERRDQEKWTDRQTARWILHKTNILSFHSAWTSITKMCESIPSEWMINKVYLRPSNV